MVSGQSCPPNPPCQIGTQGFILSNKKGLGYCSKDKNGCAVERMYSNRNCEVEAGWASNLKTTFGAYYGENCVVVEADLKAKMARGGWVTTYTGAKLPVYAWCAKDSSSYT